MTNDTGPLFLVLDTNVFLHYLPPDEVNWWAVTGAEQGREIRLVVPRIVVDELEKKKFGGGSAKLQARAKKRIAWIAGNRKSSDALKNGATLLVDRRRPATIPDDLDPKAGDDVLVASAVALAGTGVDVAIVTNDQGLEMTAEDFNIPVFSLGDEYSVPSEPDESRDRIRALEAQVARLAKDERPELALQPATTDEHGRMLAGRTRPVFDKNAIINAAMQAHRPMEVERPPANAMLTAQSIMGSLGEVGRDEKLTYNASLKQYISDLSNHVDSLNEIYAETRIHYVLLRFSIANTGTAPAKDVRIRIAINADPTPVVLDAPPKRPDAPSPPDRPQSMFESIRASDALVPMAFPSTVATTGTRPSEKDRAFLQISIGEWQAEIHQERVRQHSNEPTRPFWLWFSEGVPSAFSLEYDIVADNMTELVSGTIHVVVLEPKQSTMESSMLTWSFDKDRYLPPL